MKKQNLIPRIFLMLTGLLPKAWRDSNRRRFYESWALWSWHWRKLQGMPKEPSLPEGAVWLHLGCGRLNVPGFVNVDARPHAHIHHLSTVEKLPFIEDETVDLVYVSHCLEHISHLKVSAVLKEWKRVLKVGGCLRIAVPDFNAIIDAYNISGRDMSLIQPYLMGGQDYALNFHFVMFTHDFLEKLFLELGFCDVRKWNPLDSDYGEIVDCSSAAITTKDRVVPISLNLEATKG
ncbi:MAG: methyltransferase domain-containing protein [Prosthecobacter sp.]